VALRLETLEGRLLPSLSPHLLKDINPGSASSTPPYENGVENEVRFRFADLKGVAYFAANDGIHGVGELFKSDGTAAGTQLVKDIFPGSHGTYIVSPTNVNDTLFFGGDSLSPFTSQELWKSNGTAAGTVFVRDIDPGHDGSGPYYFTNVNGKVLFSARDGVSGWELWKTNGTSAGTVTVKNINSSAGSYPHHLTNVNGTLFFYANNGVSGMELWRSNGTAAGTALVKDIKPGSAGSAGSDATKAFNALANVNGTLFFSADNGVSGLELWKSNGTAAGTKLIKDIHPGSAGSSITSMANVNGTLFFGADDGVSGPELWKSNGTAAGTKLVKDIHPGSAGSNPSFLVNVNGTLFFQADNGVSGPELWKSNGVAAGTVLVKDIQPGSSGSSPIYLANVNGSLFFAANDGVHGFEPWVLGPVPAAVSAQAAPDASVPQVVPDAGLSPGLGAVGGPGAPMAQPADVSAGPGMARSAAADAPGVDKALIASPAAATSPERDAGAEADASLALIDWDDGTTVGWPGARRR
jgi:ELWxxDGT repeat protein